MDIMKKRIKCIPFPGITNAYIVISGSHKKDSCNEVSSNMSFLYHNDKIAVEWEPNYGPITVLYECDKDHEEAQKHFFFDYCTGYGHWSQLAVQEERLGEKFYTGNYEGLFEVLKRWSE
jgi:hypothetical protein